MAYGPTVRLEPTGLFCTDLPLCDTWYIWHGARFGAVLAFLNSLFSTDIVLHAWCFGTMVQCHKVQYVTHSLTCAKSNKKAQLSLTNPRDAKACQNCSNSTCLQHCRWQYWPILIRLAVVASEICEIARHSLKIQTWCQSKAHVQLPISH